MQPRFTLSADLQCSREPSGEAVAALERAVAEANDTLFVKGVPKGVPREEVGRITSWSVGGTTLHLVLESGGYTRAHDALFRFRKHLAGVLGKHQVGIREILVTRFAVVLTGDVPDSAIPRLPFIRSVERRSGTVTLDLAVSAADLEHRIPDRILNLVEEKIQAREYGGKTEHWELVYESGPKERVYQGNPTEEMEARHWIRHGASRGQWIYGP
ncbi:MAG: serine--tRNA ligase, partial [Methanomicrobiales archaeon]|nr:serine--tRNA ligase [Methanomicrobiales archaeon]